MRRALHVWRIISASVRYGSGSGRVSVIVFVVLGLIFLAAALTAKAVAPLAVYPFA